MKLEIRNIGRVERADIEIQGITVVAGANGTGKSTVSKALYSILDISDGSLAKAQAQKMRSLRNSVVEWRRRNAFLLQVPTQQFMKIVEDTNSASDGNRDIFLSEMSGYIKENMPAKFWNDQRMNEEIGHLYTVYNDIAARGLDYYIDYNAQMILDDVFRKQTNCLNSDEDGYIYCKNGDINIKIELMNHKITDMEMDLGPNSSQPVYITTPDLMDSVGTQKKLYSAERSGMISYANSQLTRLLMAKRSSKDLVAEKYNKIEEQKQLLREVFQEVLEGEFYLDDDQIAYHDRWCDDNIELSNISSGMKIFLILQSLVANGIFLERTCLIIDEPETNLHPEWQLKLAHLLVLLNKNIGIQVYLNSHSPYFVRAIEYYSDQYQILEESNFYIMKKGITTGMYRSECVTDHLGLIYDEMAEPFNRIM